MPLQDATSNTATLKKLSGNIYIQVELCQNQTTGFAMWILGFRSIHVGPLGHKLNMHLYTCFPYTQVRFKGRLTENTININQDSFCVC